MSVNATDFSSSFSLIETIRSQKRKFLVTFCCVFLVCQLIAIQIFLRTDQRVQSTVVFTADEGLFSVPIWQQITKDEFVRSIIADTISITPIDEEVFGQTFSSSQMRGMRYRLTFQTQSKAGHKKFDDSIERALGRLVDKEIASLNVQLARERRDLDQLQKRYLFFNKLLAGSDTYESIEAFENGVETIPNASSNVDPNQIAFFLTQIYISEAPVQIEARLTAIDVLQSRIDNLSINGIKRLPKLENLPKVVEPRTRALFMMSLSSGCLIALLIALLIGSSGVKSARVQNEEA